MKISKRKRLTLNMEKRQNLIGWLFVLPFVVGFVLIYLEIIINSVAFCFSEVAMTPKGYILNYIGLKNFHVALFENAKFTQNVVSTFTSIFTSIPTIVIFSLFVATLLNAKIKGRGFFRALFFLPVIISTGILTTMQGNYAVIDLQNMSGVSTGISNASGFDITQILSVLSEMNLSRGFVNFITVTIYGIYDIVNCSGVQIILFLAGLQSISPSVFEAAAIEGASGWEQFWKITFPMMAPLILVNCIYTAIDRLTYSGNAVMEMVSGSGMTAVHDYGVSAAMSWMYFVLTMVLLGLIAWIGISANRRIEGGKD